MERDIVNIALHISLKNFEQQCNGINIHSATLHGYLFHCGGRRFARLIRVISAALLCRRHSANGRAYPAVIPIAHVVAPDHCFQLFCRVIRTSSATTVKQLVLHSCNQPTNAFAAGVVMTSASGAVHALLYSILVQRSSVWSACVLASAVGVEDRTAKFGICWRCIFDSCSAQFGSHVVVHWQPDCSQVITIKYCRHI